MWWLDDLIFGGVLSVGVVVTVLSLIPTYRVEPPTYSEPPVEEWIQTQLDRPTLSQGLERVVTYNARANSFHAVRPRPAVSGSDFSGPQIRRAHGMNYQLVRKDGRTYRYYEDGSRVLTNEPS